MSDVSGIECPALLWDGDCGFCERMVRRLKWLAKRDFRDFRYQSVRSVLPPEVLRWSGRQMHWVDERGAVYGGSAALIEMLWYTGRTWVAAILDSSLVGPFAWPAYKLVSTNRAALGTAFGAAGRAGRQDRTSGAALGSSTHHRLIPGATSSGMVPGWALRYSVGQACA